jgi:ligand-binding sensor domain-containing protein
MFSLRFLLCFCCFVSVLQAQEPVYKHYTADDGLPSNEVYDVFEDKSGYVWFATDHGISCFDGYSFRNYSTNDGLVHNTVFGFHEDKRGRMWMRALNSSLCYMENNIIKAYRHNEKLQAFLGSNYIQRFAFDKAENLWFVSLKKGIGLYCQDAMTGEIKRIKFLSGYNAFIRELDNGEIIAGMDENNQSDAPEELEDHVAYADHTWLFRMPKQQHSLVINYLGSIVKTGPTSFAFTFNNQLVILENGHITYYKEYHNLIRYCYRDAHRASWICGNGATQIEQRTDSLVVLKDLIVTSMLEDRMGNYWFTTMTKGIYMARNLQLNALNHQGDHEMGAIIDLQIHKDHLFTLSLAGDLFDLRLNNLKGVDTTHSALLFQTKLSPHCFYFEPDNEQFFLSGDIYQNDSRGLPLKRKKTIETSGYVVGGHRAYVQSGDSILRVGTFGWAITSRNGDYIYSSHLNGFTTFSTAIAIDRDKKIWIGATDGLYTFSGNKTVPFEKDNPVFRQRVTDIEFGNNNEIFISTRGGGVIVIDGSKHYYLRATNGLSSDQCGNICVDGNVAWVCSNNGLNKVTWERKDGDLSFTVKRISTEQGLPSNMVNDAVRFGDFLFLATGTGLAWFNVKNFYLNSLPPQVYIRSFLSNNIEADPAANSLTWKDNNISIGFIALLYRSPGHVNYRYKLDGYEQDWNYTSDRMARYFNLPAGNYTFSVSAMNENGIWNERPASIRFFIPAHYTETGWFRFLVILLIAGASSGIVFFLVKQQRDKARSVLALSLAEQKALRAQMKPHFIFNSLNSIQNFIVDHDDRSAHNYLTSFAQLMRRVLDHSRFSMITLQEELDTMVIYLKLEKLRFGEAFNFEINVDNAIEPRALFIPSLFIQPYLENAIWHGLQLQKNMPRLHIRFYLEKNKLVCIIEDNGIGRKRSMELHQSQYHTSVGMKNVEERIELLNSTAREKISVDIIDLEDPGGNATGTRVILKFPINRKTGNQL